MRALASGVAAEFVGTFALCFFGCGAIIVANMQGGAGGAGLVTIALAFGWAFYLPAGRALPAFLAVLFFLGVAGGNFAVFSLWLPELFGTDVRATAFAFCTSVGRFVGAGVNFALAAVVMVLHLAFKMPVPDIELSPREWTWLRVAFPIVLFVNYAYVVVKTKFPHLLT